MARLHTQYLAAARPILPQQGLALVAAHRVIGGACHPHRQHRRRLSLDGQVGEHITHQRLIDQVRAERLSMLGMVDGTHQTVAHAGRAAERAVQPRQVDHLDDRRHAAALLADQPRRRAVVLHLARGIGMVAELVLEPLEEHPVAAAVGQDARQQKVRPPVPRRFARPGRHLREHQEDVAHRRRGEPLVPAQRVGAVAVRGGLRGTGPDVGSALLLGHRHARGDAGLGGGHLQFGVVAAAGQQRLVDRRQFGVVAQRRDDGVGHRDRADVAGFGRPHRGLGRAHDVRAGTVVRPGRRVQSVPDGDGHQLVVGGIELDLVDAVPVPVVGVQHRAGCGLPARPSAGPGCEPPRAPNSWTSSAPHSPPSRIRASARTGDAAGLKFSSGGT